MYFYYSVWHATSIIAFLNELHALTSFVNLFPSLLYSDCLQKSNATVGLLEQTMAAASRVLACLFLSHV